MSTAAFGADLVGGSIVNRCGSAQSDTGMSMGAVVVGEEHGGEPVGLADRGEPVRERRTVLQGLEIRFAVRVVVGHSWPRVRTGDVQIAHQLGDGFAGLGAIAIMAAAQYFTTINQPTPTPRLG
ncbi:hypothetical protein [Nocardia sp. NPDC049526]|uniref:hypothetical protein n=1 Tax=Nocardia sp. NPDC049526 TaxID=3364316 RepID=UPI0037A43CAD